MRPIASIFVRNVRSIPAAKVNTPTRRTAPFFAVSGGILSVAMGTMMVVHTEGETAKPYVPPRTKRSIYDDSEEEFVPVEEPTQLELAIRQTRHTVTNQFATTRAQIQSVVDKWIHLEQQVTGTTKKYIAPGEPFLPGAIYVTLSGFAGSILAKNRSLLYRSATPATFALVAFSYFYPGTSRNIVSAAYKSTTGRSEGPTFLDVFPQMSSAFASARDLVVNLFGEAANKASAATGGEVKPVVTRTDQQKALDEERKTI
ncbi:uncharacterized protein SPPG_07368 [Spizellomyces punctatus DAOM BR117]|uniref:MICOS complex subunit n=1 Tax=Spizellomyces punctatus (strain DAOM BR117) TaxID=645134 RepID=A0A0L0H899_SPIPD|nr:uncharacterized protein SPPG_07368 [Spizellomyces punctatus DAOM BR117]KNC97447.1 hypothetical protein SPPG_07368 [Spizellomyces punctatus DAOM BR117]|eukprot:XP_016605487.1 hypothetical protein SPPG_07368 [Spizellomyces punctatus DAOM BR117]